MGPLIRAKKLLGGWVGFGLPIVNMILVLARVPLAVRTNWVLKTYWDLVGVGQRVFWD